MIDLTGTKGSYVRSLEYSYVSILEDLLIVNKHEKSASSEWRLISSISIDDIKKICAVLTDEVHYDMKSNSLNKRFNLSVL